MATLGAAVCAVPLTAQAEALTYMQEDVSACTNDAFRFCSDLITDLPAIKGCLETKAAQNKLSPACAARFAKDIKR